MKSKKRYLTVFGTRPEAIKLAPLCLGLAQHETVESHVCVTGQHRQMLDQVMGLFRLKPDYDLNLMTAGQTLTDITVGVIRGIEPILREFKPDRVFVQGDTTTAFAASLAAFYQRIPVCHIEAGLRTHDIYSPFPEEMNRRLTGGIADLHFAPTDGARQNLLRENVNDARIEITGNTGIDALYHIVNRIEADEALRAELDRKFSFLHPEKKLLLVTGHRRENFGDGMHDICRALATLSQDSDIEIVFPVHLNPNVQTPVRNMLSNLEFVHLTDPQEYLPFVYLMMRARVILTDSGGIQEEAPSLGKPVVVMRETTERPEAVDAGTVCLVGTDKEKIVELVRELMIDSPRYVKMSKAHNPYGDGRAVERIIDRVLREDRIGKNGKVS